MWLNYTYAPGLANYQGLSRISLGDMLSTPEESVAQVISNLRANAPGLIVSSTLFNVGAKMFRRLLRPQINQVNRMVFTGKNAPLRGAGIRI